MYVNLPSGLNSSVPCCVVVIKTAVNGSPSGSLSLSRTQLQGTSSFVSSLVMNASGLAIGGSCLETTVILTVPWQQATGLPSSQILYSNVSSPWKFAFGVYVNVPSSLRTTVPCAVLIVSAF